MFAAKEVIIFSFLGLDATKAKIVLGLNFQSPDDALPFYKLPVKTLYHIYKTTKSDESKGFCQNRLYYIASRLKVLYNLYNFIMSKSLFMSVYSLKSCGFLQVPPSLLSEKLAKRTFIYSLSFDWIQKSLDVLIGKNQSCFS